MRKTLLALTAAAALWLPTSCIVLDQIVTLTVEPAGAAHWTRFHSNIRSSEKGEKGAEELRRFVADFEARRDSDCERIRQAGGEILEARFVRKEEPYSTVVSARLPGAKALEDFCTIKDEKGETVARASFTSDGRRRRLALTIPTPKGEAQAEAPKPNERERRLGQANDISEIRVAVVGGEIIRARGFTVAEDKRSALLEPLEVEDLLRGATAPVELFLEWDLVGQ